MSSVSQESHREGNTKPLEKRSKRWCFTLNNYTEEELSTVTKISENKKFDFFIFGKEVGESGTPHLQGYLEAKNAIRFKTLKNDLSPRVHLEVAKGTRKDNIKYCSKDSDYKLEDNKELEIKEKFKLKMLDKIKDIYCDLFNRMRYSFDIENYSRFENKELFEDKKFKNWCLYLEKKFGDHWVNIMCKKFEDRVQFVPNQGFQMQTLNLESQKEEES